MTDGTILAQARQLFARDPLLHFDMDEALRRGDGTLLAADGTGALVRMDCSPGVFFLTAADEAAAERFARLVPEDWVLVVAHQRFAPAVLARTIGAHGDRFCCNAVYPHKAAPRTDSPAEIRPLTPDALDAVRAHYQLIDDPELFRKMMADGWILGAYLDGELAGFAGVHEEGAMGMLEVFPAFRRRGLARALESAVIARFLALGQTPYCQVFEDNDASLRLQAALGLERSRPDICWCGRN